MTLILVSGITKYNNEFSHLNESILTNSVYLEFPINNTYLYKSEILLVENEAWESGLTETYAPSYTMGRDLVEDNFQFSFSKHLE